MSRSNYGGPRLPRTLLDQVESSLPRRKKPEFFKSKRSLPKTRREERHSDRGQKRPDRSERQSLSRQNAGGSSRPAAPSFTKEGSEDENFGSDDFSELEDLEEEQDSPQELNGAFQLTSERPVRKETLEETITSNQQNGQLKKPSRAVREKLAEDDAEIAKLEKKLGIKDKKKLPKPFKDDGLDMILDDLGASEDSDGQHKRKRDNQAWLESKRRKLDQVTTEKKMKTLMDTSSHESPDESELDFDEGSDDGSDDGSDVEEFDSEIQSELSEHITPEELAEELSDDDPDADRNLDVASGINVSKNKTQKVRENPYFPPGTDPKAGSAKYIPPSRRMNGDSDVESTARLNRQLQGLLNRLSDANILSILKEVEALYQNNPRQFVTSGLINLLLSLLSDRSILTDTFIILHAGFIGAVFKVVGTDFGAQFMEEFTMKFDKFYEDITQSDSNTKELTNLVSLLSQLYILQVMGPEIIFDYIRIFLGTLSELHTELLLRIIKYAGTQLRQDDPTSLKDIVIMLQRKVSQFGEAQLSVRTRFMIESINDLKNNRMKAGVAASAIAAEHITRMKKTLGSLNSRNLKATEPLHINLSDIRNSDKRGKWWLVGASWKGKADDTPHEPLLEESSTGKKLPRNADATIQNNESSDQDEEDHGGSVHIPALARKLGMNTTIRRTIFTTLITSSDYKDACTRLLKLRLNRKQQVEIPRVLLRCATAENSYNAYYTLIARKLCSEKKLRMAFQFSLWDFFKQCGQENGDHDMGEDYTETIEMSTVVNYAKLFADLLLSGSIGIGILKTLDFAYLSAKVKVFAEVLLVTVILQAKRSKGAQPPLKKDSKPSSSKISLERIFHPAETTPDLRTGLQYFLMKSIARTDLVSTQKDKQRVKERSADIMDLLVRVDDEDSYIKDV